jgi:DNA-directed RNA polymerase subunit K/omega
VLPLLAEKRINNAGPAFIEILNGKIPVNVPLKYIAHS